MTIKTQTTLASAAGLLWKVIEFYDLDPEPFFRKAHINPQLMNDPQARFSLRSIDTIYKELYETINDPCMGLKLASLWHPSHLSSLGYAWLASSTLYTALNRLSRYVRIINDAITVQLEEDGNVTDSSVSEAVYTSKRSLQRKLYEKGTTFKTILTEVREDLALKYIYDRTLTLTEISFMLGFSEMSSFSRAFKRWTGESPKEFRKLD